STSTMRPHRSCPRTPRTSTLPRRSRATSMVSRSKNSWLRTRPDGMAPFWLLAPGIADFLARRVAAALVDVQLLVGLLVHRLPVHARLPRGDAAVDGALELGPVGQTREVIGASLFRVLPGAIECDRDLVGDRGHELQVAGLERARQPRGHRHRAEQNPLGAQLGANSAPLAGDAIDARLGGAGRELHYLQPSRPSADRELALLARLES